jgi:hypothetical protein
MDDLFKKELYGTLKRERKSEFILTILYKKKISIL